MAPPGDDRSPPLAPAAGIWPYLLVALAALCWAGNHVVGRAVAGEVPPLAIAAIRWVVPSLILLPVAWPHLKRDWPALRGHWWVLIVLSVLGGGLFGALQYVGLKFTTAINVSVLNSLAPVLIALAGAALFRDRLGWLQALGVAISLGGVLAIVGRGDPSLLASLDFNWGDLIIVFNMVLFGVYSACLRLRPQVHALTFMLIFAVISSLATIPFAIAEHLSGDVLRPTLTTLAALAYASIFPSLVANMAWNRGVELIGSIRSGAMLHLIAIYSAILASLFLGEHLLPYHFAGFALILAGVWLAARKA